MPLEKPEFTEEQRAYFRECGRKGGNSRTITDKSREASRQVMLKYWEDVRAGKRPKKRRRRLKQSELPFEPEE